METIKAQDKYNKTFYELHKHDKIMCPICKVEYSIFNKSHHLKGKLHNTVLKLTQ
jgi:hypothetical protein